ncbi:MAG: Xaa-Pro peptidase family protein [Alphaproteobacteria bacterium]|nr:Xaa-Pro peptidase family protein [Alphaproteobacteria bacterium]
MISATPPPRGFPVAEYEARLTRCQARMAEAGLSALLLTTEPEVRYFSGFLTQFWQSPTRPWFLVVPASGKPVAVIPEIGGPVMARTWVEDIRTWPAPDPRDDGIGLLAATLKEIAGSGDIGLPMGPESHLRLPLAAFDALRKDLPGNAIRDASPLIVSLRQVKSPAEIAKIGHICAVASAAFAQAPSLFASGQPLIEAFRSFKRTLLAAGADDVPYLVGGAGPDGYVDVISPPTDVPLRDGDILMLDTGGMFDGYFCDFDRNWAIGRASEKAKAAHRTLHAATDAALAIAKPGTRCRELFATMHRVIAEAGGVSEAGSVGRYGHGLGMQLTEWPSHAAWDETVLEPGMVLTLEPSMTYASALEGAGRLMVHEENLVVTEDSPVLLTTRAAPELPVIG